MNNVSSGLNNSRFSKYPMWYCPAFSCPFRTEYASNIGDHLKHVHNWSFENVGKVIDRFFRLKENGVNLICCKHPSDPTYPKKIFLEGARDD